jgi:hypothetical protein
MAGWPDGLRTILLLAKCIPYLRYTGFVFVVPSGHPAFKIAWMGNQPLACYSY